VEVQNMNWNLVWTYRIWKFESEIYWKFGKENRKNKTENKEEKKRKKTRLGRFPSWSAQPSFYPARPTLAFSVCHRHLLSRGPARPATIRHTRSLLVTPTSGPSQSDSSLSSPIVHDSCADALRGQRGPSLPLWSGPLCPHQGYNKLSPL
jgi:hypothetical protein